MSAVDEICCALKSLSLNDLGVVGQVVLELIREKKNTQFKAFEAARQLMFDAGINCGSAFEQIERDLFGNPVEQLNKESTVADSDVTAEQLRPYREKWVRKDGVGDFVFIGAKGRVPDWLKLAISTGKVIEIKPDDGGVPLLDAVASAGDQVEAQPATFTEVVVESGMISANAEDCAQCTGKCDSVHCATQSA